MTLWILSWNPNDSKRSDRLRFYMRCPFFRGQSNEAAQAVDKKTLNIVYISICVCVYIYNINAFRDHLGIEASGFHASPWTMHIADIYSTEAARFTLQQLQHDQYRQLIGNIYIYMYKMQPCNVMSYEVAFSSSISFATGWVALFVRRLALSDGAASHFSGRGGLPRGLWIVEHWWNPKQITGEKFTNFLGTFDQIASNCDLPARPIWTTFPDGIQAISEKYRWSLWYFYPKMGCIPLISTDINDS